MTIEELDKLLADFRQKHTAFTDNFLELSAKVTYKWLTGDGLPKAQLTGTTKALIEPALKSADNLWLYIGNLGDLLTKGEALRKQVSRWKPDVQQQLETLLTSESIELAVLDVPIDQRDPFSSSQQKVQTSPAKLLEMMRTEYIKARDAVSQVESARNKLFPSLLQSRTDAQSLQQQAKALGEGTLSELDAALAEITRAQGLIDSDPLSVQDGYDSGVKPLLDRVRTRLTELQLKHDQLVADLSSAKTQLTELDALRSKADAAWQQVVEDIDNPQAKPRKTEADLTKLRDWLPLIEQKQPGETWQVQRTKLDNWLAKALEFRTTETAAADAYQALTDERLELRGLLSVYKRRAEKKGQAEDVELAQLIKEAEGLLYHPGKTPLARARELVTNYGARLRALTGTANAGEEPR